MPITRAQKKTDSEGGDKGSSASRHRNAARAKSKDNGGLVQAAAASDDNDEVHFDDEEPDIGKTLHAKDGFVCATNFLSGYRSTGPQHKLFNERIRSDSEKSRK